MNIESRKVSVNKSGTELFKFLTDLNNYEELMPENTEKFEIDGDSFIFGLKGMPEIRLIPKESTANSSVILGAASSKIPFTLAFDINELENTSEVQIKFHGDFNPMITMMAKKPLTRFIETLIDNLEKL
jgi:carbon monoxide dehydrogenase subunit G